MKISAAFYTLTVLLFIALGIGYSIGKSLYIISQAFSPHSAEIAPAPIALYGENASCMQIGNNVFFVPVKKAK